jgi:hypothetical protein
MPGTSHSSLAMRANSADRAWEAVEEPLLRGYPEPPADPLQEVASRGVLRRRLEEHVHVAQAAFLRDRPEPGEHPVLDAPAQRAAAQQEALHPERARAGRETDHADQAIVAEPVPDMDRKPFSLPGLNSARDLAFRAPDRGRVELVRPLRQLRDPAPLPMFPSSSSPARNSA